MAELHNIQSLITEHIDLWTGAVKDKSSAGRGSRGKRELYGIKKLRELILELAVRGKLVAQDSNDEPASVLLERIATEKAELIKQGKIAKVKILPEILDEEKPFELPKGWEFARIGNLVSRLGSGSTPRGGKSAYVESGIPFLRSQNIWNDGIRLDDIAYITDETHRNMSNTIVKPNDVLLNITGASLGRCTIFPNLGSEVNVNQHVTIIRLVEGSMSRFMHLGIISPLVQKLVWGRQVGMAIEGLSKKVLEQFEFPVPPLAEQHRIVAKVDELMALCDQLEQQTESSLGAHQTLVQTLLDTLLQSADAEELEQNWQRLSVHFDLLFTTEQSIDQLKQTILQLAVMGKLVPQDPNDEPASELLKRIAAEKEELVKQKKIKKQKPLPPISDDEKPFQLPKGWSFTQFDFIAENENNALKAGPFGSALKKNMYVKSGYKIYGQEQVISGDEDIGDYFIDEEKYNSLISCRVKPGDILISLVGTIGKLLILSANASEGIINPRLVKLGLHSDINREFIRIILASKLIQDELFAKSHGSTMNVLNLGLLRALVFPLPPVQEQHRIVAKVDQLMAFCDQLKAKLADSKTTQLNLTDALVAQAV